MLEFVLIDALILIALFDETPMSHGRSEMEMEGEEVDKERQGRGGERKRRREGIGRKKSEWSGSRK